MLPLIGVTMTGTHFAMVSEWMADGNLNAFTKAHPDEDKLELVGFSFEVPLSSLRIY